MITSKKMIQNSPITDEKSDPQSTAKDRVYVHRYTLSIQFGSPLPTHPLLTT